MARKTGLRILVEAAYDGALRRRARSCTGTAILAMLMGAAGWAQSTTTISGRVYDPRTTASALPLPNVLVYATTGAVMPLPAGVQCLKYQNPVDATSYAQTAVDGKFTLKNVPVNTAYTVVIQAGKWRRLFAVPVGATAVTGLNLHMPSNHTQGDIPLIAIATGVVDGLECVLRDMGIADTEFTDDTGSVHPGGRIHLYQGSGAGGEYITPSTPWDTALTGNAATLNGYDMVMFPCQGGPYSQSSSSLANMVGFANAGGRIFTTHYSLVWLDPDPGYNSPFPPVAKWNPDGNFPMPDHGPATVNTSFADGATMAQWLKNVGATIPGTSDQVLIGAAKEDIDGVIPPTQAWLNLNRASQKNPVMQMTFNTPVGAAADAQCGRVFFNEYHVIDQLIQPVAFPSACPTGQAMSAQEEMLEYALFDLSTFVQPVVVPSLTIAFNPSPLMVQQNDTGVLVTVSVANTSSNMQIDGSAVLTVTLPAGVTAAGMTDSSGGWDCTLATLTCSRTRSLGSDTSDAVSLTLAVGAYPPGGLANPTGTITAVVSSPTFSSDVTATDKVIFQQPPPITWATPAPIVYGTPLSGVQLNATSTVAGSFTYTPGAGTVLSAGQHKLTATFAPADTVDYATGLASVTLTVVSAIPQIQVTASANPVFVSNAVTFTANVASQGSTSTGTVTFYDGTTALGTETANEGTAKLTTAALPVGGHALTAVYSGGGNFQPVTSAIFQENIEDFALSVTGGGNPQTVYPGTTAVYLLNIAPLGGATLAEAIDVSVSGLPAGTKASISPATVGANSGATNLTLRVTPASMAALEREEEHDAGAGALGLALGLVLLPWAGSFRRWGRRWLFSAVLLWGAALAIGISSCSTVSNTPHDYTLTVTGVSGNLRHTAMVKLTVE